MKVNEVYEGDCLDVMRGFPDNCIDSVITDPPYDLTGKSGNGGFMGKRWDASGIAFNPEVWHEVLRIAKPGATLMAFGGSRTYHLLTCAIEDAGWEIRDCISYFNDGTQAEQAFMASLSEEQLAAYLELHRPARTMGWVTGSGFPKSLDIGKKIDEVTGAEREIVGIDQAYRDRNPNGPTGTLRLHGFTTLKELELAATNGEKTPSGRDAKAIFLRCQREAINGGKITAPATPLAKQFDGYGTALKPAHEPIVVAMKPMGQSFAANAEKWGVSGIWVDGGRVETEGESLIRPVGNGSVSAYEWSKKPNPMHGQPTGSPNGRWPANVIHDGSEEVMAEFDKAGARDVSGSAKNSRPATGDNYGRNHHIYGKNIGMKQGRLHNDSGSAARYFAQCPPDPTAHPEAVRFKYCPKAGKRERATPGNNHPTQKPLSLMRYLAKLTRPPDGGIVLDPFGGSGTTALACIAEGRDYIIIEKESEYAELCRRRIAEYTGAEIVPKEVKITEKEKVKQLGLW